MKTKLSNQAHARNCKQLWRRWGQCAAGEKNWNQKENQKRTGFSKHAANFLAFARLSVLPICSNNTHFLSPRSTMTTTLLVGSSPDALATELIRRIGAIATESVQARGVFNVAVSGGSMPKVCCLCCPIVELTGCACWRRGCRLRIGALNSVS